MEVLDRIDAARLDALRARDEFFWLDLHLATGAESAAAVEALTTRFGWHPLVARNLGQPRQRPKLEPFGDYSFLVFYGARQVELDKVAEQDDAAHLAEVHLVVSGSYVVSLHPDPIADLDALRGELAAREGISEERIVYEILDRLTSTYFDVLDDVDGAIDTIEDEIVARPTDEQLDQVFHLKRVLIRTRRVVDPQRDLAARALEDLDRLPGLEKDGHDYFRDVYDHLLRISDRVESYRDLLTSVMDVYLSTVSNRLNVVMKQLTVVATIFLPLSFVTGFFGMNFAWMVRGIGSRADFLWLGLGTLAVSAALMLAWFARKGWLRS